MRWPALPVGEALLMLLQHGAVTFSFRPRDCLITTANHQQFKLANLPEMTPSPAPQTAEE